MKMNCGDESWENAAGNKLELPVTKESADEKTLVCNTYDAKVKSNHGTCHVDDDGNPHLFFRQQGQVLYFRWLCNAWQAPVAVPGGDGDMIVESPQVVRMLLSGGGEVCWWKTTDGGLTWGKDSCLISSPSSSYVATALVRKAHPDGRMVVNEHNPAQNHLYRKLFLLGDSGPVGRPEEGASNLGDRLKNLEAVQLAPKQGKADKKNRNKSEDEGEGDE